MKLLTVALLTVMVLGTITLANAATFSNAQTGTQVSGIINSDTTWDKANSPYALTGNVCVNQNITLTVEAGVIVNLVSYYIQVDGTLVAKGTTGNQISFNGGYITFTEKATNWTNQDSTGCIIENANLNHTSIFADAVIKINNNTLTVASIAARNSVIVTNNVLSGQSNGIGLTKGSPTVTNNFITGANSGISLSSAANAYIAGNTISNCNVGISGYDGSATIERNLIINNQIGIGIPFRINTQIQSNTIAYNKIGLSITITPQGEIVNNNIQNNTQYSIRLNNIQNVNAANNYWGTTDAQVINQSIYDSKNDFNLGTVNFTPFLTSPNNQAPVIPITPNQTATPTITPTQSAMPTQVATPIQSPQPTITAIITNQPSTQPTSSVANNELILMLVAIIVALAAIIAALLFKIKKAKR